MGLASLNIGLNALKYQTIAKNMHAGIWLGKTVRPICEKQIDQEFAL